MSKLVLRVVGLGVVIAVLGAGSYAIAGSNTKNFSGTLVGFEENPDVSTPANGSFDARLSDDGTKLMYRLTYADIGGGNVLQAHIHFAKRAVNGAIVLWLCSNLASPPTPAGLGIPACPSPSGTVTGELDASDVQAVPSQGIPAGQAGFDEMIDVMRAGRAYANVHSTQSPGGEIRAQLNDHGDRGRGGDD
jgi:hypothetical protein